MRNFKPLIFLFYTAYKFPVSFVMPIKCSIKNTTFRVMEPWQVWLSGLGIVQQSKSSAHAWVAGQNCAPPAPLLGLGGGNQPMFLSLSSSLSSPLSENE